MPLDFASIIRAGQSLVPDIRAQMQQDEATQFQRQLQGLKVQEAQQKQARMTEYQQAIADASKSGKAADISRVMARFPEFADQLKPGWEGLREDERRNNRTQTGSAYIRAQKGDYAGAAGILKRRLDADREAGQQDETSQELYDALNSGDADQQKLAVFTLGSILAADDPATFKALNPTESNSAFEKEYEYRVGKFGKAAADQWAEVESDKFVPVEGKGLYKASDLIGQSGGFTGGSRAPSVTQEGGDPSTATGAIPPQGSAIEQAALSLVPGLTVTSRQRSPSKNTSVGGVQGSYHLTDQARDFVPPKGMSFGMLAKRLKDAMPGFDVINEGDHVHVEPGPGMARRSGGPAQVKSKQQYERLPAGTQYVAPDGSLRVKR